MQTSRAAIATQSQGSGRVRAWALGSALVVTYALIRAGAGTHLHFEPADLLLLAAALCAALAAEGQGARQDAGKRGAKMPMQAGPKGGAAPSGDGAIGGFGSALLDAMKKR